MNCLSVPAFIALLICYATATNAQPVPSTSQAAVFKPEQFQKFPAKSECPVTDLNALFSAKGKVSIAAGPSILLKGQIIENTRLDAQVQTIKIQLDDYPGAIFTLTHIKLDENSERFTGRVISPDYSDALVLSMENGKYYLTKTERRLLEPDHP